MPSSRSYRAVFLCLAAAPALFAAAPDDRLAGLTQAVTAFKLPNGAQFFVVERPYSPMVAVHLRVKAGIADEPSGRGGLATLALLNFLEGSEVHGSRNPVAEKAALVKAEALLEVVAEQAKADQVGEIQKGRSELYAQSAFNEAAQFAFKPRYFESILTANGATGVQIHPAADFSDFSLTIPSNRAELWFRMTSSWLQAPSARFFPQSRELVLRQRERAAKTGRLLRERALGAPFLLHPYQAISSGEGELSGASVADVLKFLKTHYVPANLVIALVGDISAAEARRLADTYFGPIPAVAPPPGRDAIPLKAESPPPVRLAVPEPAVFAAGWPRPASGDGQDDAVFELLEAVLAGGPQSRLQNEMSAGAKLLNRVSVNARFPGGRYPGLFVIEAAPLPSQSHADVEDAIGKNLMAAAKDGLTDEELERARWWWRSRLLAEAIGAPGRALQLVRLHTEEGSYKVEEFLAKLDRVTVADCQRVIKEYLAAKPYFSVLQFTAVAGSEQQ